MSETVPDPALLNTAGPMFAWFDGDDTVGITGPTGYGFTLEASGKLKFNGKTRWSGSIDANVRSDGFQFRFPMGVGTVEYSPFE